MHVSLVILAIAAVLAGISVVRLVTTWLKFRGQRVILCPENSQPAGVEIDARHAAAGALGKAPELRLSSCSRWPERSGCGEQCLAQIEASPMDCLVRTILARWYAGRNCACCGQPIGEVQWAGQKPAVLQCGKSVEWNEIPADKLYEVLATSSPICFGCHMANQLVRKHPELVVNRTSADLHISNSE